MSYEQRDELVREICALRHIPSPEAVLQRGILEIDGFDVAIDYFEEDEAAVYATFHYGIVTAGRRAR